MLRGSAIRACRVLKRTSYQRTLSTFCRNLQKKELINIEQGHLRHSFYHNSKHLKRKQLQTLRPSFIISPNVSELEPIRAKKLERATSNFLENDFAIGDLSAASLQELKAAIKYWDENSSDRGTIKAANTIAKILYKLEKEQKLKLSTESYNHALSAWRLCCRSHGDTQDIIPIAIVRIEELLKQMLNHRFAKPNTESYTIAIDALQSSISLMNDSKNMSDENLAQAFTFGAKAESYLDKMLENSGTFQIDVAIFNRVVDIYAKTNTRDGALNAQRILNEKMSQYDFQPNVFTFASVLNALSNSKNNNHANVHNDSSIRAAKATEYMLHQMETLFNETNNPDYKPNTVCYNTVINAWNNCIPSKHVADRVNAILAKMLHVYFDENGDTDIKPDVFTFTEVIHAYAGIGDAQKAEEIFARMQNLYEVTGDECFLPNTHTFSVLIDALSKSSSLVTQNGKNQREDSSKEIGTAQKALQLLRRMEEDPSPSVEPNIITYTAAINALAHSKGGVQAAKKAENMLNSMLEKRNKIVLPNVININSVMLAWAKSQDKNSGEKAQAILDQMLSLGLKPDVSTFNTLMSAHINSGQIAAPKKVEDILRSMENRGVKPDARSFTIALDGYAKSTDLHAPEKAEAILELMEEMYEAGNLNVAPNTISLSLILKSWATSRRPEAVDMAEKVLERMENAYEMGNHDIKPNKVSYNALLHCYANSTDDASPAKAEKLLDKMIGLMKDPELDVIPDVVSFNMVMNAYKNFPEKAESVLLKMQNLDAEGIIDVHPDFVTFNTLIKSIAKSNKPKAFDRLDQILDHMILCHKKGFPNTKPDTTTLVSIMSAFIQKKNPDAAKHAERMLYKMENLYSDKLIDDPPNILCYSYALNAMSYSRDIEAPKRAGDILNKIVLSTNPELRPNITCFNFVLNGWARSRKKDATKNAESLFEKVLQLYRDGDANLKPNLFTYVPILRSFANSRERDAGNKAESYFNHMLQQFKKGDNQLKPNTMCFNSVIQAYCNELYHADEALKRITMFIQKIESLRERGGIDILPNTLTYNLTLKTLAKSKQLNKAERALKILQFMEHKSQIGDCAVKPQRVTFSSVIRCCVLIHERAHYSVKQRSFKIAIDTLEKMRSSKDPDLSPNNIIYGNIIQAAITLLPKDKRGDIIMQYFNECCADGQLDPVILRMLNKHARVEFESIKAKYCTDSNASLELFHFPPQFSSRLPNNP